ncbi:MAG: nucleotidyltransferase domain-containing protein [Schwartzia sp.]|nr:nucleotidyltransferase domain-containing protein [Schwartzia sp. (in: firmicutes)]MBR5163086.1 nucleotidyltransferase domain-containing protein [Schwartzia sp. (in: firmicutes)]
MKQELQDVLKRYTADVCALYGERLCEVILYGSYARGDYREDSDIDIMVLVDMDDEEIRRKGEMLSHLTYEYNDTNDILIMPIVVNINHFNRWVRAYPFYNNVWNEGIELYEEGSKTAG